MEIYLRATEIIDYETPAVRQLASSLAGRDTEVVSVAKRCFEWVRDEIKHSNDYQMNPSTCTASEVLGHGTGFCYAKSHLLAALLRANGIATGLCYQRLSCDGKGAPFVLHGLNAVYLPGMGWYRVDPRGNRHNVNAQFTPPVEQLAWPLAVEGEADLPEIWPDPLPMIVEVLRGYQTYEEVRDHLPDLPLVHGFGLTKEATVR